MSQFRGIAIIGVVGTAFLALVGSFILGDAQSSKSNLFCVTDSATNYITTLSASVPQAKCFRIENGFFTELLAEVPEDNTADINYLDGYVLPGIIESHGHILQYGEMLESVSLYEAGSVQEVGERIKQFLQNHPGEGYGTREKWIRGIGWDQKYFGGVMPTAVRISTFRTLFLKRPQTDKF
jgi:predicted amidohydrolase YtcJ